MGGGRERYINMTRVRQKRVQKKRAKWQCINIRVCKNKVKVNAIDKVDEKKGERGSPFNIRSTHTAHYLIVSILNKIS